MPEFQSWGVSYNWDIFHALDFECQCGEKLPFNVESRLDLIVGFQKDGPPKDGAFGGAIFECPKCCRYFWIHFYKETLSFFAHYSPKWPKRY